MPSLLSLVSLKVLLSCWVKVTYRHYIKNNAWVIVNNDFFVTNEAIRQWWKSLPNRLTSDKKSLFTETNVSFYFLHTILCHELINPLRTIIERSFRHCCQGRPFLTEHCDVTTIDHVNAKYWYCDIIFVYCRCTCRLAQRWSSLVNNSRMAVNIESRHPVFTA